MAVANVLYLGPLSLSRHRGYYWHKTGHNKNFTVSEGASADCTVASKDREEEYTYRVYCLGSCVDGLGASWARKQAIDDVLDLAITNGGRMVLLWRENGATLRRELLGGVAKEADFELQRQHNQIIPLDVSVTLRDSLILDPIYPAAIDSDWCDNTKVYKAVLVDSASTVLTQGPVNYLADYTSLSEFDGTNYARALVTARTCAVAGDMWSCDDISFPGLGAGTLDVAAMVIYHTVGPNDVVASAIPYPFFGGMFVPGGGATTFRVNAQGLLRLDAKVWF